MLSLRDLYTNPSKSIQIKYFEIFGITNWIHDTNLLKTGLQIESAIQIFQVSGFASPPARIHKDSGFANLYFYDLFCALVLRIFEDSWGFIGFVKIGQIFENWQDLWFKIWNESFQLRILCSRIRYESRICFVRHRSNLFGVRIGDHDTIQIHGFTKRIHVFTTLLYDSRNLNVCTKSYETDTQRCLMAMNHFFITNKKCENGNLATYAKRHEAKFLLYDIKS